MNLDELRQLPPAQAMQVAAQDLSLPANFFDRQWAQESGRGQNMLSPAGARGHFGIMPKTQAAWEQRNGASYNPDDFYDGLYMAHSTMKENLAKFKDPVDATRAYNSGWDPSRWGNPETVGYVKALWGDALPSLKRPATPAAAQAPIAGPDGTPGVDWPVLPSLKADRPAKPEKGTGPYDILRAAAVGTIGQQDGIDAGRAQGQEAQAAAEKEQARKDNTHFGDVVHEALRDPRIMPTWSVLNRFAEGHTADPGWDYLANRDQLEAGRTDEERAYLRENAISAESAQRATAELDYRRGLDQTYADSGNFARFTGQMVAGLADPTSLMVGVGVGKSFQLARIGSGALSAAGRPIAALGALAGENAVANMGIEGLSDAMGEVKTSSDYAGAALTGALFSGLFARGVFRQASEAAVRDGAQALQRAASEEQVAKVSKVMQDEPHLGPEQVARKVEDQETEQITRAVSEATGPVRQDPVVPRDVQREMADEFSGVQPEAPAPHDGMTQARELIDAIDAGGLPLNPAKLRAIAEDLGLEVSKTAAPEDTIKRIRDAVARADEQPKPVVQQIREEGTVTRKATDTATGQEVKLTWSAEGNKRQGHGNIGEALDAIASHAAATPEQKALATYLQKVMAKETLDVEVHVTAREARSQFDPTGPQVRINRPEVNAAGGTLGEKIDGLSRYGVEHILHETMHAATYHRLNAWEHAAGKLTRDQQKLLGQFQDLFDRFRDHMEAKSRTPASEWRHGSGAKYAASDIHEFAAQFFTDAETRLTLDSMPGKPLAGRASSALREMLSLVRKVLGFTKRTSAFEEGSRLIDQIITMPMSNVKYSDGRPVFTAPTAVTELPKFKEWFGKSKIVGPDGTPLVMYHGTPEGWRQFTKFEPDRNGLIFVTPDAETAGKFAGDGHLPGGSVIPLYVKAEKPFDPTLPADRKALIDRLLEMHPQYEMGDGRPALIIDGRKTIYSDDVLDATLSDPHSNWMFIEQKSILDTIEHLGYDAVHVIENGVKNLAVFEPQQLKSALANSGEFHPDSPSILESSPVDASGANPMAARNKRDTWAERMTSYAQDFMARNPIDVKRLQTLTQKIGGVSDGLILASSKNPIMQLVASLVTETTTGAAGRKANVAIRSHMLTHKFVGNTMIDFDNAYTVWRGRNGGSVAEDLFRGEKRRQFDKAVYTEVVSRRGGGYAPSSDKAVLEAADALQGLFERSRVAQVDAAVLGAGALPTSSKGYIPQALDGAKLQAASVSDLALLHDSLAKQFQDRLGWDEKFARSFAPFYTERVRRRAMGDKGLEALGAGGEGLQLVRDTLQEMHADPSMVDRARAAESKMGQSHTKARLDIDLTQELRPGLRMLDFYNTNPLLLARSYAKRTAGTVALTEAGIHGIRGVRELEQAALYKQDGTQPTARELEAYRRIMAEVLGTPVATAVVSNGATNMGLIVSLQRLGGMVFTQAAETFNMIQHLGLRSMLSGISELPRMMGEVGRLKKGGESGNHILTSIEQYGGEFGTEAYKMVAPLDAPDHALAAYVDQPGVFSRVLRAGGHLQSKISGFRGVMAAQHRMVAEQIVMKAARFIRDGGEDIALRDMGFTPEVVKSMKGDLERVAKWDVADRLQEFDLTRVTDPRTAEAFVQAVHRGTSQIIQGTFIGERSKWMHNDYAKVLLQLRSFGLTATEKQWGRTRMNHGYAYAAAVLTAQMALTLPIHLARIQLASVGRTDREEFIKDNLRPFNLTKALMNYASMSGLTADTLDVLTGIAGGWGGQEAKDLVGGRNGIQATSISKLVPGAGSVDTALRAAGHKTDLYTALKQLPYSNLWYLLPLVNLSKH